MRRKVAQVAGESKKGAHFKGNSPKRFSGSPKVTWVAPTQRDGSQLDGEYWTGKPFCISIYTNSLIIIINSNNTCIESINVQLLPGKKNISKSIINN